MADTTVSIIVPTYNERDNIITLVERLNKALSGRKFEIVIVDDNSKDGTAEAAQSLAAKYPVRTMVRKNERGLASAVVHGFNNTTSAVIGVIDADLQHPPEVTAGLLQAIDNGADLAIGSRYVKDGGCEGWSLTRRIISKGAIFLSHLFLPKTRGINDPMAGFFMLRRSVIDGAKLQPTGYKILLEILIEGKFGKVAEVPFIFKVRERGESKLKAQTQIDYLKHLFSLMRRSGEILRFVKFAIVGGSGVLVNLGVYALLTRIFNINVYGAQAISFEASVITNFLFNNFFTFADRRTARVNTLFVQFIKFNAISLGGYGLQALSLWVLYTLLGINDIIAVAIGIIIATIWNYLLNTWWTWK